jgi:hypothetical protein
MSNMKKLSILGVSLLLTLFGCGKQPIFTTETFTLNGKLLFRNPVEYVSPVDSVQGQECYGHDGYSDINGNLTITVKDGTGNILATGKTESGKFQLVGSPAVYQCIFVFYPITLPKSDFYVVSLTNRGEMTFSLEDLKSKNWTIEFALGRD